MTREAGRVGQTETGTCHRPERLLLSTRCSAVSERRASEDRRLVGGARLARGGSGAASVRGRQSQEQGQSQEEELAARDPPRLPALDLPCYANWPRSADESRAADWKTTERAAHCRALPSVTTGGPRPGGHCSSHWSLPRRLPPVTTGGPRSGGHCSSHWSLLCPATGHHGKVTVRTRSLQYIVTGHCRSVLQ